MSTNENTVTISKDEYIELLRCKAASFAAVATGQTFSRTARPHSWTSAKERAEMVRLHRIGYGVGEIAHITGRARGTVAKHLRGSKAR